VTMRDYLARQAVAAALSTLSGSEANRLRVALRTTRDSDRAIQLCAAAMRGKGQK